jgi:hypothetical protein
MEFYQGSLALLKGRICHSSVILLTVVFKNMRYYFIHHNIFFSYLKLFT